ncbi:MAG: polyprenyl synthetase family protein [Anaplasmataceae bacterium]|nr:polyprenyl synthetase family protein [Anaplasmataceae bacterium]
MIEIIEQDLILLNKFLIENDNNNEVLNAINKTLFSSGGKKLRGSLVLLFSRIGHDDYHISDKILKAAAAVEYIHHATLLHDDVIDDSLIRRGKKNSKMIWGNRLSILAGDWLLSQALKCNTNQPMIIKEITDVIQIMIKGEIAQLKKCFLNIISSDNYFDIIYAKTASLFGASCKIGSFFAKNTSEEVQNISFDIGKNIGINFQIMDDILDYQEDQSDFGKIQGHDFINGKVTLPLIIAYEKGTENEREFWLKIINESIHGVLSKEYLSQAIVYLNKNFAFEEAKKIANNYLKKTEDSLRKISFDGINYNKINNFINKLKNRNQ